MFINRREEISGGRGVKDARDRQERREGSRPQVEDLAKERRE